MKPGTTLNTPDPAELRSRTLRRSVEALDQFGRILAEEALPVHDADVGVATAVQDVGRVAHQQREAVGRHRTQIGVVEQREELQETHRVRFNK